MLSRKGINRVGSKDLQSKKRKRIIRARSASKGSLIKDFQYCPILYLILKYESIIKMDQDLMEFILEKIYLIK